jgi:hypothetical protein
MKPTFTLLGAVALALGVAPVLAYEESTEVYESHESTTKKVAPAPPVVTEKRSTIEEETTEPSPSGRVIERKRTVEVPAPPVVRERKTETETIEK